LTVNGHFKEIHIGFQGEFAALSQQRQSAALEALAAVLKIPSEGLGLRQQMMPGDAAEFEMKLPTGAVERLRTLLQTNNGQLRLLGLKNVILEGETGKVETWRVRNGRFDLEASGPTYATFEPVPRIWLYHLIYLMVTIMLAISILRFSHLVSTSLLLISAICLVGILFTRVRRELAAHVLAVAIGLGAPIVVCARLFPTQTLLLFLVLISGITIFRRFLF